jgi:sec-independent protein translocase protein TatC
MGDEAQPLTIHLEELRARLLWCLGTVGATALASSFYTDILIHQMARHIGPLVFLTPTEALFVRVKMAFLLGIFFSVPVILYHLWKFIGVALTVNERRVVWGALPFSYLLFAAGAALAWFLIVPMSLKVLVSFASLDIQPMISVDSCLQFSLWMTLGLGLLFQLPVVLGALSLWGFVRSSQLKTYRRHAIIIILVLAALLTPGPDPISQILLALPSYLLFEISILLAKALEPTALEPKI